MSARGGKKNGELVRLLEKYEPEAPVTMYIVFPTRSPLGVEGCVCLLIFSSSDTRERDKERLSS